jgi:hypothetical protein
MIRTATWRAWLAAAVALGFGTACTPRVQLEAPREPIVINVNVKVEQEIRVRVDRDVETLIASDEDLFGKGEKP